MKVKRNKDKHIEWTEELLEYIKNGATNYRVFLWMQDLYKDNFSSPLERKLNRFKIFRTNGS